MEGHRLIDLPEIICFIVSIYFCVGIERIFVSPFDKLFGYPALVDTKASPNPERFYSNSCSWHGLQQSEDSVLETAVRGDRRAIPTTGLENQS